MRRVVQSKPRKNYRTKYLNVVMRYIILAELITGGQQLEYRIPLVVLGVEKQVHAIVANPVKTEVFMPDTINRGKSPTVCASSMTSKAP